MKALSCRFPLSMLSLSRILRQIDQLKRAILREQKTLHSTYGAPTEQRVHEYRIFLQFEDNLEIAWDTWGVIYINPNCQRLRKKSIILYLIQTKRLFASKVYLIVVAGCHF